MSIIPNISQDTVKEPFACRPGYTGPNCDQVQDVCIANDPCENDGICRPKGDDFQCDCPVGYTGDICQHRKNISQFKQPNIVLTNKTKNILKTRPSVLLAT